MTSQMSWPTHLLIETTTRCNLRCKQCAHVIHKYDVADMALETFYKLRPLFPTLQQVALYGHGETFLYRHFFEMLAELKQYPPIVYVTTNGTRLTAAVSERLVELGLDKLAISLDAATPELFNEIRRGADFDAIIQNIRTLNAIKQRRHRDDRPILSIMYCAMQSNIQELPKLVRLADELNMTHGVAVMNIYEYAEQMVGESLLRYPELAETYLNAAHRLATQLAVPLGGVHNVFEGVRIQPVQLHLWGRCYRTYREFKRSFDRNRLLKLKVSRIIQRLKSVPFSAIERRNPGVSKLALTNPEGQDHDPASPGDSSKLEHSSGTSASSQMIRVKKCRDPWEFLFVDVHGNVRICCTSHRIMGNVHEQDLVAIWNSPAYQAFRAQMVSPQIPDECQTCVRKEWETVPI